MKYRVAILLVVLAALVLPLGCPGVFEATEARATEIIDGDTIVIAGGEHIRYIGIDTPELGESFYQEAKEYNRALVEGKTLRLEKDVTDRDEYGRLLRYVYVDSLFVNAELVRQGYAYVYPKGVFQDNKYYDVLKEAEAEAQREGRGLWAG